MRNTRVNKSSTKKRALSALLACGLVAAATGVGCGSTTADQVASEIDSAAQEAGDAVSQAAQDAGSGDGSGGGDTSGGGGDTSGGGGGDTSGGGGDTSGGGGNTAGIPATDPNTGDSSNSTPIWVIAVMLGLVGLLIGFILRGNRSRSRTPARQEVAPVGPGPNESASDALSTAQWMVDDLAIDITNPQASQPQQRMASASPRLDDAHIAFIDHYNETGNEVWNELSRELSATRSGLEQYAQIVSQPGFDQNTAQQASQVVNQHRSALNSLIQQGWNALRAQR